jgi:putative endonuclease
MISEQLTYYVYIITNSTRAVLYTGITNDLEQRIFEHYHYRGTTFSFTSKYFAYYLLYYECFEYVEDAIAREKQIKGWTRNKKLALIKEFNPEFRFLNRELFDGWPPKGFDHRE